ncbi:dynein light chain Tctex-type 5 [Equus caballus]|uniref:dynein light chain Tctex-type 5 n=1 Tax=Equus caballus TaxID=9796 RepID=UPI0003ACBCDB|nr:tctex1 domain-containing protein 1 [Equus caballus]XP_008506724.1 PREDICTED: tctex1 domain-containing protein 1 [Equus przewalskii]XP_023497684.1 tctex1 domain-containing protein 1 [Equus caballus]
MMTSDTARDAAAGSLKRRASTSSLSSRGCRRHELHGRPKGSMSTVSYVDEPGQQDDVARLTVQLENTYQLGPTKPFPVVVVNHILKDVLSNYLREERYDPEVCRQMAKTVSEVIKGRVKDLLIPRYKLMVVVHIGQLTSQSILIGSRCLWDPKSDTFSSYVFRNSSLFALANVYAVYFE